MIFEDKMVVRAGLAKMEGAAGMERKVCAPMVRSSGGVAAERVSAAMGAKAATVVEEEREVLAVGVAE